MAISRRSALKIGAATVAVSALSGCQTSEGPQAGTTASAAGAKMLGKHQIVVIGGGFGGLTVAKELKKIDAKFDVLIIEKNDTFMSCPFSNTYLGKLKNINLGTLVFDYAQPVVKNGYSMLKAEVKAIDSKAKVVTTTCGAVGYDILILSPGISYNYEAQFKNWDKAKIARARREAPGALIPGSEHVILERQLANMEDGDVVITVPAGKFRCPPAPFERASMIAAYMKKEGISGKVHVVNPGAKFAKFGAFMEAWNDLYKDIIVYHPNSVVSDVDFDAKEVSFVKTTFKNADDLDGTKETHKVKYQVLNLIPANKANEVVAMSGVATAANSFVLMNGASFRTKSDENIYAIGDIVGHGIPPSGQTANWTGKQCALEVAHRLHGKPYELEVKTKTVKAGNVCFSMVGDEPEEAVRVVHDFSFNGTVIGAKGNVPKEADGRFRGGMTAKATHEWYRGIMNDLFA